MLILTSAPSTTLASLSEAKAQCGIDDSAHDTRLNNLLAATRDQVEKDCNLHFTAQTWKQYSRCFPAGPILVKKNPVSSLVLKYYNSSNVETTLSSSDYYVLKNGYSARIHVKEDWPEVYERPDAVWVEITIATSVPAQAKQASLMLIGALDKIRESELPGVIPSEVKSYSRLIQSLRNGWLL